ncbi:MAG: hypothetical protein GY745_04535 [Actinomycetia bacterium]|nr:hypothetical protein [Actinomycetes bacterium]MCP4084307.1 hypothetical protein [Actinomycetes bacterium]
MTADMDSTTIGIIANPLSGKDVRRLLVAAGTSTLEDKISVVRRIAIGAREVGVDRLLLLPDPHRIGPQALERLDGIVGEAAPIEQAHNETDTECTAAWMADQQCGAVAVLGGDGTSRVVTRAWSDAPLLPISTGTNNAFPIWIEATVAGAVLGLVATGAVPIDEVAEPAKVVRIEIEGETDDLALIDALHTDEDMLGFRGLFDPRHMRTAVLTRAEPAAIGISSIAGLLDPCPPSADRGVHIRFGAGLPDPPLEVRAPTSPGRYVPVPVEGINRLELGERVEITGPGLLSFDGDRRRRLAPGQQAWLRVERDGPRVLDPSRVMAHAAASGHYLVS